MADDGSAGFRRSPFGVLNEVVPHPLVHMQFDRRA